MNAFEFFIKIIGLIGDFINTLFTTWLNFSPFMISFSIVFGLFVVGLGLWIIRGR